MLITITEVIVELCEILVNEIVDFLSIIPEIHGRRLGGWIWTLHFYAWTLKTLYYV